MGKECGWKRLRFPAGVAWAFLLTGCLYTTHHFNTGRLLEPGHSEVTLGAGTSGGRGFGCPENTWYSDRDSTGAITCHVSTGTSDYSGGFPREILIEAREGPYATSSKNASIGYRVGAHGRLGPLTGVEMGLHLETPTNPVTAEFDFKLGLPTPAGRPYHHSLSAGWGIGAWADNSWFLEYAASRAFGASDLFCNYRATYLATQYSDMKDAEDTRHFDRNQRLIHQAAAGFKWSLPAIPVLPDFLAPEAVLTYPLAAEGTHAIPDWALDHRGWGFNLGMGWNFR